MRVTFYSNHQIIYQYTQQAVEGFSLTTDNLKMK
jgi:hypothetical protein